MLMFLSTPRPMKLILFLLTLTLSVYSKGQIPEFTIPIKKDSLVTNKNVAYDNVVFLFLTKECPYTAIYNSRIIDLIQHYPSVLFINLGNYRLTKSDNLIQYHDKRKYIQSSFKARKNPSSYFFHRQKGQFELSYWGAIDDNPQLANDTRHNYLKTAINGVLKNEPYYFKESRPVGCKL